MYVYIYIFDLALSGGTNVGGPRSGDGGKPCQGHVPTDREPLRNMEERHSNTLKDELVLQQKGKAGTGHKNRPKRCDFFYFMYHHMYWAPCGAFGRSTALQAGRSRIRFPMVS